MLAGSLAYVYVYVCMCYVHDVSARVLLVAERGHDILPPTGVLIQSARLTAVRDHYPLL